MFTQNFLSRARKRKAGQRSKHHGVFKTVPTNKEVFCAANDYVGKVGVSKGYWNLKRKLGNNISKKRQNIKQCMTFFLSN